MSDLKKILKLFHSKVKTRKLSVNVKITKNQIDLLGDSGSPLAIKEEGNFVIIGLVSFGAANGCDLGKSTKKKRKFKSLNLNSIL